MTSHQRINQTSGKVEYYTPEAIIEAARACMGGVIDLDPASSDGANKIVRARRFYSERGLEQDWRGNVWVNHPFSRENNPRWVRKMDNEYRLGNVTQICCITFAATSEAWFQLLLGQPQCFLSPRTNYRLPDGSILRGVTKGSVVTYFGPNVDSFAMAFQRLGVVKVPFIA